MLLKCQWCKKDFEASRRDAKYCSRSCQAKASRDRLAKGIDSSIHICPKCGQEFKIKDNANNRRYCYDCVPQVAKSGADNRSLIKQWALTYKGKKCARCGYNNCIEALDFHHIDPTQKDFNLSDRNLILDWEVIKLELDKCILLCANCHRELHAGLWEVKQ